MKSKLIILFLSLLLACVFTACTGTMQTVEVTRLIPQTVEITKIVTQEVVATHVIQDNNTEPPEPVSSTPLGTPLDLDTAYYDGTIVITQYYTFLGNGLYEQAYRLLSAAAHNARSLEDYMEMASHAFKAVEIDSILPYYIAVEQQGGQATSDPSNKKRFAVQIRSWGEGNASGSQPNGGLQELFLGLVLEDGKWKIDSFATAPVP